ncbi:MAG: DNA adenine methylase [Spirochaetia bacterium]|nr:DNA adenine methylase [Spirochaetia bacterium]
MGKYKNNLSPIIKWAGGKEKELPIILQSLPFSFEDYYEPFVGGGAVFTAIDAKRYFINDKSLELVNLYTAIMNNDEAFFTFVNLIMKTWKDVLNLSNTHSEFIEKYKNNRNDNLNTKGVADLFLNDFNILSVELLKVLDSSFPNHDLFLFEIKKNLFEKIARMNKLEKKIHPLCDEDILLNIQTGFLSGVYMYFRDLFNNKSISLINRSFATALFMFIRNYSYSGMFRYNAKGEFNVPYGGIGYNNKTLDKKIDYYQSEELKGLLSKTEVFNLDFEDFLNKTNPGEKDFMFLDPPYDTEFSTYAKNTFDKSDQIRLANYLINECKTKWMLVIKSTPFILSLYENNNLNIHVFDKKYLVSFMNRNNKDAQHLLITNY